MSEYEMENGHVTFRRAKVTDAKSIIKLLGELERPLSKDRNENKRFQKLKDYMSQEMIG